MRKWLVLIAILAVVFLGVTAWLGQKATSGKPQPGEQRIEIENVFQ